MKQSEERARATILVVDDNEANRALARGTLEDEDYRVIVASGGAEGVEAFEVHRPDCVILDVRMPGVDGLTACKLIRELPSGAETPVLFLTALRDVDTFDQAMRAGGDDFLTKPIRPAELCVRVETALKLRRLSTELREHYDLLKSQRDDLLRVQLQKERLMAFVVHDLKNPVNSMDLHAQVVLREPGISESARESAKEIRAEARHLTRMILNLLDLARADEGKLRPVLSEVDLHALVLTVFAELEPNAGSRKVQLESRIDTAPIRADEHLLRRMLTNLVDNAIRHAPLHTAVTVSGGRAAQSVEIRVTDQGGGIPAAMKTKIFEPFVQIDDAERARTRSGRGLGLAFCRLAALAHEGEIWVEDGAQGSVFCVRLPSDA